MVNVGEKAPDFTLKNTNKDDISLGDYSGKTCLLYTSDAADDL